MGAQITAIPEAFADLLTTKRAFAHLATVMPDGTPQVTPIWFDWDGTYIRVNSARGRQKDRNMRRIRYAALSIQDPDNPYRYIALRGPVVEITEEGADAHIDSLARKYTDAEFKGRRPGEVRVMYKILPEHVATMG
ncbi:MAG: PPOX class F420-dependent oxidoreductase [Anaerolineae bacterium]|nr:PPOX class F420-dependent oxidoreductase [Anaerolineae bacterium]